MFLPTPLNSLMAVFAKSAIFCTWALKSLLFASFKMSELALQYVRACEQGVWGKKDNLDQWLCFVQDVCVLYWQMDEFSAAFTCVKGLQSSCPGRRVLLETGLLLSCPCAASASTSESFPVSFTKQLQLARLLQFDSEADLALGSPWTGEERWWRPSWRDDHALVSSREVGAPRGPAVLENIMWNWKNCSPDHIVQGRRRREEYILGCALKPASAKAVSGFHVRYSNAPVGLLSYIFHIYA